MFHHHYMRMAYGEDFGRRHAHGFFGHRQGSWRGMRAGRFFDHGDLRFLILKLIADKPRHGYELIKAIEEEFGGAYSPSPGVIYPTLTMLEDLGYTAVAAEGNKKLYTITPEGRAFLAENQAQVDAVFGRLKEAGQTFGGGRAPEIKRAVHNLRLALATRLGRGTLTQEQILAVTAVLDRAAGDIERI
ncbi:MAG TPA: PadR family transcriptional regulator [Stellaceae bacterium]|jgi:DNA-binding PadR family transcriptional regulator|nr:PadR family transcriptional regulator [Stellaceae bacterium]